MARLGARSAKAPPAPLDSEALEARALGYLNRFDCSVAKLRRHLRSLVARNGGDPALLEHIDALLARYQASGLLDDTRFAGHLAERYTNRGASRRAVVEKLRARGVDRAVAEAAAPAGNELAAARALVRRRKLGPHRPEVDRAVHRRKDLAVLARAGFDHDTAVRALGDPRDDEF